MSLLPVLSRHLRNLTLRRLHRTMLYLAHALHCGPRFCVWSLTECGSVGYLGCCFVLTVRLCITFCRCFVGRLSLHHLQVTLVELSAVPDLSLIKTASEAFYGMAPGSLFRSSAAFTCYRELRSLSQGSDPFLRKSNHAPGSISGISSRWPGRKWKARSSVTAVYILKVQPCTLSSPMSGRSIRANPGLEPYHFTSLWL